MARYDFGIEDVRKMAEQKYEDCDNAVIIIKKYPEINYVLAYRNSKYQPWVAAWNYNGVNSWGQGHYFEEIEDAIEYIHTVQGKPNWYRLNEIASKAIDYMIETDPYEAEEFLKEELELDWDEVEYFCVGEKLDEEKEIYDDED